MTAPPIEPVDPHDCPIHHDEDGDQIDDFCDNCPTVANPDQLDTTEVALRQFPDRVGNACDLWPALGGDLVAHFATFADSSESNQWRGSGWTIADDQAHAAGDARWEIQRPAVGSGLGVQIELTGVTLQVGGEVAVVTDGNGLQLGFTCAIVHDRDGDGFDELEVRDASASVPSVVKSLGVAVAPTDRIRLTAIRKVDDHTTGNVICRVKLADQVTALEVARDDVVIGSYAMAATAATADVTSLIAYTSPASQCPAAARCNQGSASAPVDSPPSR